MMSLPNVLCAFMMYYIPRKHVKSESAAVGRPRMGIDTQHKRLEKAAPI